MTAPGIMALTELQRLIAERNGVWEHGEFKKSTGELLGGMESLCGFLNGAGGKVFFGVTNTGRIVGQDVADATFQEVASALRKLAPPAWIVQTRVPVAGNKGILILETTLRTVRQDLTLLRQVGLVGGSGRGAGARWWLVTLGTAGRQVIRKDKEAIASSCTLPGSRCSFKILSDSGLRLGYSSENEEVIWGIP